MSEPARALIDARPYDCKIQSISDIKDGRVMATVIRRDNTSVGISLSLSDLEYWEARIASILDRAREGDE